MGGLLALLTLPGLLKPPPPPPLAGDIGLPQTPERGSHFARIATESSAAPEKISSKPSPKPKPHPHPRPKPHYRHPLIKPPPPPVAVPTPPPAPPIPIAEPAPPPAPESSSQPSDGSAEFAPR